MRVVTAFFFPPPPNILSSSADCARPLMCSKQRAKLESSTVVARMFGGELLSRVTCGVCKHKSDTRDIVMDVGRPFPKQILLLSLFFSFSFFHPVHFLPRPGRVCLLLLSIPLCFPIFSASLAVSTPAAAECRPAQHGVNFDRLPEALLLARANRQLQVRKVSRRRFYRCSSSTQTSCAHQVCWWQIHTHPTPRAGNEEGNEGERKRKGGRGREQECALRDRRRRHEGSSHVCVAVARVRFRRRRSSPSSARRQSCASI